jgi:hypothetical protein
MVLQSWFRDNYFRMFMNIFAKQVLYFFIALAFVTSRVFAQESEHNPEKDQSFTICHG